MNVFSSVPPTNIPPMRGTVSEEVLAAALGSCFASGED